MKISRLAVPAMLALSLAACSSDDDSTGGGSSSVARIQAYQKFSTAASNAADRGAYGAANAFLYAGLGQLFGSSTASVTVSSNGQASLSYAGRTTPLGKAPAFATAGTYSAFAISAHDVSHYTGSADEVSDFYAIVAYRDTTAAVFAIGDNASSGTFDNNVEGYIYEAPSSEWYATAGNFSLGSMSLGSNCPIDAQIQAAIEGEIDDGATNFSFTCKKATFNGVMNITGSTPANDNTTGERTAGITANGLPGIRVESEGTYDNSAIRSSFLRHKR